MALGSWSAMRKYLEQEMLASSLQGRVRYQCTHYDGMDGWGLFEVYIDGRMTKRFSLETLNTFFVRNGYKENSAPIWDLLSAVPLTSRTEYTDREFSEALGCYRNQPIEQSINSENPIERMFAVMDRRIGKRRLPAIKAELNNQPDWLREFYRLRFEAEKI